MTEADIEIILQAAKEKYPEAKPRIITDSGPQFIARDFKEFIRIFGHDAREDFTPLPAMAQIAEERVHPGTPLTAEDARRLIQQYVDREASGCKR
jgi:putative transposase